MNKYSYYTPAKLADQLVEFLPKKKYESVIDICCGTWNLLSSAKNKYPNAKFYGVDVDESIAKQMFPGAKFVLKDGRAFSEQERKKGKTYDLILSNPPFGNLEEQEVYWGKNTVNASFSALRCKRYELEMMLANIHLAHENSVLMFILPITFVRGKRFKEARKQIAKEFTILEIIELPLDTFGNAKLKTAAIIMEKRISIRKKTHFRKAYIKDSKWEFELINSIMNKEIKQGNWLDSDISTSNICIKRGTIHTGEMNSGENIVLHCSSNYEKGEWIPSIRYTKQSKGVRANSGDILINRIGRGAGYWCINSMNDVRVSDCIFVLKNNQDNIVKKLCDNTKHGKLNVQMRGVSTAYITQADICKIIKS